MRDGQPYRPEIDGLRALAVLAILFNHAGVPWLPGGYLGVDIFFVISGFVITRILAGELAAGQFSLLAFWRRRMRRILPALIVLLLICLPLAWFILSPNQLESFLPVFLGAAAMVPNMVLEAQVGYFAPASATQPLLHLWSLGVEEQFYLIYPVLLLGLWRTGSRSCWWALVGLALVSLIVAQWLLLADPRAGFYYLPPRAWELLAGGLAALSHRRAGDRGRQVLALVGMGLMIGPMLVYGNAGPGLETLPVILGAALCLTQAGTDTWAGRALSWQPVVVIGKISFGTYLWHWPLLAFVQAQLTFDLPLVAGLGLMVIALGLGWASWRFVETPFRRSQAPVLPRAGIGWGLGALAVTALVGGAAMLAEARGWRQLDWPGFDPYELAALPGLNDQFPEREPCHLMNRAYKIEPFLAAWDCPPRTSGDLVAWDVAVFGDSHADNFANVLRLTGRSPMQMSGWGCSIVPSEMRPECRIMADVLRKAAKASGIKAVILANEWQEAELTPEALVELELWWAEDFDTVVVVGPLPSFEGLEERLLLWPIAEIEKLVPDMSKVEAFAKARKRVAGSEMQVIDAAGLFCADRPDCGVIAEWPLMQDESPHLTLAGATIYAQGLVASGQLEGISP
jgi:peptidoglycan/LPS O-acetylase OafA/YrhL